jgi:site-specific recombinase XerD
METLVLEDPKIKKWLSECRTENTKRTYINRIERFFEWYGDDVDKFLNLKQEELHDIALQFQNTCKDKPNSILSTFAALNSFLLSQFKQTINFQRKKIKPEIDLTSHVFSNGDLAAMFNVGNTKEKTLLSLSCSLGWEIGAILELDRKTMSSMVKRAKETNEEFVYFISQRKKTHARRLGVLNPTCLEWMGKWLKESEGTELRKRKENKVTADRPISDIFDLSAEGVNNVLKRLAKDAQIVTTGRVHFHKIRGWVMSGLSRSGFNMWQIKYLMGKSIPITDATYLQSLQQEIEERYPSAFEHYLNLASERLTPIVESAVRKQSEEVEKLKAELEEERSKYEDIGTYIDGLVTKIEELSEEVKELKIHNQ